VHEPDQHQSDRLGEVEGLGDRRVVQDRLWLAQVGQEERQLPLGAALQQGPGVRQHDGVVVHVHHPRLRRHLLGYVAVLSRGSRTITGVWVDRRPA
jgi:hypothetical protein